LGGLFGVDVGGFSAELTPEKSAALACAAFLDGNPDYEVFAVRNQGSLSHVWGVRRDLTERRELLLALHAASNLGQGPESYQAAARGTRAR
jgi:hypothetical protein